MLFTMAETNLQDDLLQHPLTVGWREWVKLPDLGIKWIKAKIDTGAYSSSLHAFDIEKCEIDGEQGVRFKVQPGQKEDRIIQLESPVLEFRSVRSSNGESTVRPVIKTRVRLMKQKFDIELTLIDRRKMGFRMLVGREALRSRFVVDPAQSYLSPKPKRKGNGKDKAKFNSEFGTIKAASKFSTGGQE